MSLVNILNITEIYLSIVSLGINFDNEN